MTPSPSSDGQVGQAGSHGHAEYYRDYWRSPALATSEHVRWKVDLTRTHPRLARARSILDVGCGSGVVLDALRASDLGFGSRERRLAGVEIDPAAADSLRARGIEGHAVDLESERLPFADGEFDAVLCYDVLEHVFAPGRLAGEIRHVMRPDGVAFLCVPNSLNLFNRLVFLTGRFVDVMDTSHREAELFSNHIRLFSEDLFGRFVAAQGFRAIERHHYFPARFSDSQFRLPPWLTRVVTAPRLHERWPSAFALGFLYVCDGAASPGGSR